MTTFSDVIISDRLHSNRFLITFPRPYPCTPTIITKIEKINPTLSIIRCWFILSTIFLHFTVDCNFTIAMHRPNCSHIYRQIRMTFLSGKASWRETFRASGSRQTSYKFKFFLRAIVKLLMNSIKFSSFRLVSSLGSEFSLSHCLDVVSLKKVLSKLHNFSAKIFPLKSCSSRKLR